MTKLADLPETWQVENNEWDERLGVESVSVLTRVLQQRTNHLDAALAELRTQVGALSGYDMAIAEVLALLTPTPKEPA